MKKILMYAFVLIFISSFAFVILYSSAYSANSDRGKSISEETGNGNGQAVQTQTQTQSEGEETQVRTQTQEQIQDGEGEMIMVQERQQIKAQTSVELKQMIQEKRQEMEQELDEIKTENKEVRQNQNQVMVAVHSLLASEELVGGIGPQVSEIAREFNNSVQATLLAEEKINSKSRFVKLFIGGDDEAADEIEQEVNANRERIKNLNQLMDGCECGEEVRNTIQEQIMNTVQEQDRLEELAINERAKKGLFGWFKNIFRFGR